jgi:hypothetical protein
MASIVKEAVIEVGAPECWGALRDFGALHQRLAPGFVTDVQMVGPRDREVTFFTGAVAREYLIGTDDEHMRLAYSVTESPLGASHQSASAQVISEGGSRCRFVWITDVVPDELAERIGELMDGGMRAMKQALEAAATHP